MREKSISVSGFVETTTLSNGCCLWSRWQRTYCGLIACPIMIIYLFQGWQFHQRRDKINLRSEKPCKSSREGKPLPLSIELRSLLRNLLGRQTVSRRSPILALYILRVSSYPNSIVAICVNPFMCLIPPGGTTIKYLLMSIFPLDVPVLLGKDEGA